MINTESDLYPKIIEWAGDEGNHRLNRGIEYPVVGEDGLLSIGRVRFLYDHMPKDRLEEEKPEVIISDRVLSIRTHRKTTFLDLGNLLRKIQVMLWIAQNPEDEEGLEKEKYKSLLDELKLGDILLVKGRVSRTRTNELTILSDKRPVIVTPALVSHQDESDRITAIDREKAEMEAIIIRNQVEKSIALFLNQHGFLRIDTSILQATPSGANARAFKTYLESLGKEAYLRIAPELELKMMLANFPKVYELGPSFRNEGIDNTHSPEFYSVEFYAANTAWREMMHFSRDLILQVANDVNGSPWIQLGEHTIDLSADWREVTFTALVKQYADIDITELLTMPEDQVKQSLKIILGKKDISITDLDNRSLASFLGQIYNKKCRPNIIEPTFITAYPSCMMPLARPSDENPLYADVFQLVIGGTEYAKGYQELNNPFTQYEKMKRQALAKEGGDQEAMDIDLKFIRALAEGIPPCTGVGIGIERLVALMYGTDNIHNVVPSPIRKRFQVE